jgi:hypothetical protein
MAEPAKYMQSPTPERVQTYGLREDGTPKGPGFFGEIPRTDNPTMFSGELSATGDLKTPDGKPVLFPLLVPTLTRDEVNSLVSTDKLNSGDPKAQAMEQAIYQKAQAFAAQRLAQGLSPFAGHGEQRPLPGEAFRQGFQEEAAKLKR